MTQREMQAPAKQPIGFWTARAAEAIRVRIRAALAEAGLSQPEWWVLHQLSLHPDGMDRAEMLATIGPNDTDQAIDDALSAAAEKGWLTDDESVVHWTSAGRAAFERGLDAQRMLQAERMQGITDDDYVTTITVLQRMIDNVGGEAWHW